MKIKELDITANIAWSPGEIVNQPIYLVGGTAAQQLDASFSTSSSLEVFSLDLSDSGQSMPNVTSFPVEHRYHKVIWGSAGIKEESRPNGIIVGGLDKGTMTLYDAHKLIKGEHQSSILASKDKHTGPVQALDFNPFQSNLLASGASESELFIWDINKLTSPMNPGAKSQPLDDVRDVSWNRQVQHILASCFASRCVVWDLRKSDPIIKVSDSTSRMRSKVVAWHPDVATQLCLASEDDHTPVIQIWDLRLASSPVRILEGHQRGVLSLAWCQQDPDLLISCAKDNRILVWNPNSTAPGEEVQCELSSSDQWCFDVAWCPKNPAVIASSGFDGHVSVYSLMGGQTQDVPSSAIADSFPGMEVMKPVQTQKKVSVQLKNPPKWLKRPCGASFGFGGKLVTFETVKPPANQPQAPCASTVRTCKVITDPDLIARSQRLEVSIQNQNLTEFCDSKIATCPSEEDQQIWRFIRANFNSNPRMEFADLLDFNQNSTAKEIEEKKGITLPKLNGHDVKGVTDQMNNLDTTEDRDNVFEAIAAKSAAHAEEDKRKSTPFTIFTDESDSGTLGKALLTGNIELAVEICLEFGRTSDALILAAQGSPELLEKTRSRYLVSCTSDDTRIIQAIVSGEWKEFVTMCNISNWKEALVAIVTYASNEDFSELCSMIGDRLRSGQGSENSVHAAMLCYICAGNLEKLVECWMSSKDTDSGPEALQDLVEVVMSLKSAVEQLTGPLSIPSGVLSSKLSQYASLLASQGALEAALSYLDSEEENLVSLRERLNGAIGRKQVAQTRVSGTRRRSSGQHYGHRASPIVASANPGYSQPPTFNPGRPDVPKGMSNPYPNMFNPAAAPVPEMAVPPVIAQPVATGLPPISGPPLVPDAGGPGHVPPTSSGPGWNDPPAFALNSKPKIQVPKTIASMPDPITQPLFGSAAPQEPLAPPPIPGQFAGYQQTKPVDAYNSVAPPPPVQSEWAYQPPNAAPSVPGLMPPTQPHPQSFMTPGPVDNMPANFQQVVTKHQQVEQRKNVVVEKGPIPQEHVILQEVFDSLRNKCLSAASHPQIKRKLEDVAKKLEILYDKLRDESLPDLTLAGLHRIVSYIRTYDYPACLSVVNDLVSTGSFAVLSEFLPGVKVLLQVSSQLGIYLESRP